MRKLSNKKVFVQVALWEDQLPQLSRLAQQFKHSNGKIIRDAVADYLERNLKKEEIRADLKLVPKD